VVARVAHLVTLCEEQVRHVLGRKASYNEHPRTRSRAEMFNALATVAVQFDGTERFREALEHALGRRQTRTRVAPARHTTICRRL